MPHIPTQHSQAQIQPRNSSISLKLKNCRVHKELRLYRLLSTRADAGPLLRCRTASRMHRKRARNPICPRKVTRSWRICCQTAKWPCRRCVSLHSCHLLLLIYEFYVCRGQEAKSFHLLQARHDYIQHEIAVRVSGKQLRDVKLDPESVDTDMGDLASSRSPARPTSERKEGNRIQGVILSSPVSLCVCSQSQADRKICFCLADSTYQFEIAKYLLVGFASTAASYGR